MSIPVQKHDSLERNEIADSRNFSISSAPGVSCQMTGAALSVA